MNKKQQFGTPKENNATCIDIINKTQINTKYLYKHLDFRDEILTHIKTDHAVLDIGKSSRDYFDHIIVKKKDTMDINDFGDYPNIIGDLCEDKLPSTLKNTYDIIICQAILEHVYDPTKAVTNIRTMLREDGVLFGYVPYLYRYHAPEDLTFQDYYRFSKDALSYLLRDFSEVTLYPTRGLISTSLLLLFGGFWKRNIEKLKINYALDRIAGDKRNIKQCSGFFFIAKK
ncbi:MAG: class I SAM-dependent methyltransferase [Alphaproteobacteria bacterium]